MKTRFILITLLFLLFGAATMAFFQVGPTEGTGAIGIATAIIVGGIKSSKELREQKGDFWDKAQGIVTLAKGENRALTADEVKEYDGHLEQMRNLDTEIKRAEEHERRMLEMAGATHDHQKGKREKEEVKKYSLLRAMSSLMPHAKFDGLEKEMHDEAQIEAKRSNIQIHGVGVPSIITHAEKTEARAFSVGEDSGTKGGANVQTDVRGIIAALTDEMVLAKLGVQMLPGLVGNLKLPRDGSLTAAWEGEVDTNAETDNTTDSISLTPHRLGAKALISHLLMAQAGNQQVEQVTWNKLKNALDRKLQDTFINGAGTGDIPEGLLNLTGIGAVIGGANGMAPSRNHLLQLEKKISGSNADGPMKYLTNTKVRYKLKDTKTDTGSGRFVWEDNNSDLLGYPAVVTNAVPSDLTRGTGTALSAILMGVWEKAMIGQWAGIDMVLDPYTKADTGQVRLIINSFWDIQFERPQYFAAMVDAITEA